MTLLLILVLLVVFDLAALRHGADSRPSIAERPSQSVTSNRHAA